MINIYRPPTSIRHSFLPFVLLLPSLPSFSSIHLPPLAPTFPSTTDPSPFHNSNIRQIPDNQEVFQHPSTWTSLIIDITERAQAPTDREALDLHVSDLYDVELGERVEVLEFKEGRDGYSSGNERFGYVWFPDHSFFFALRWPPPPFLSPFLFSSCCNFQKILPNIPF